MDNGFARKLDDDQPVRLGHRDRFTGTYIVGKMGMGKSTLIQQLARAHIDDGDGFLVMEPKGDLIADILKLIPEEQIDDVILLDYGETGYPPGFDIFDLAGIDTIHERAAYIREIVGGFEKTLGKDSWGNNIENLFMAVANTFTENPGVVLSDIKKILTNDAFRARCARKLTSPFTKDARDFWATYDRMKGKDTYINGTLTRVQRFLFDPILQAITVQSGRSLDVGQAIREHKIVLISLPERTLGAKGMELLGTLYLSRIRLATQRQFGIPEKDRIPFFVYLDEFQRFASGDIESFIAEARGAKVGLTMAHQWRSQIDDPGVRAAPQAVGNTFVFQVTPEDAAVFARGFSKRPGKHSVMDPPTFKPPTRYELSALDEVAPMRWMSYSTEWSSAAVMATVREYIAALDQEKESGMYHKDADHYIYYRMYQQEEHARKALDRFLMWWSLNTTCTLPTWEKDQVRKHIVRREPVTWPGMIDPEELRAHPFTVHLVALGDLVATEEDAVEAHDFEDPYRKEYAQALADHRDHERAYRRMLTEIRQISGTEIAKELTQLPNFNAHCKIKQGDESVEMTIAIDKIEPPDASYEAEIRERSRRLYCVTMEEAMALITARQEDEQPVETEIVFLDAPPKRGGV